MVFQTFNKLTIVAFYQINKKVIAEVLCVNKDKPELNCNGKCYLVKKLKEEESKHESQDPFYLSSGFEILFDVPESEFILNREIEYNSNSITPYLLSTYTTYFSQVFHPPANVFV